MEISAALENGNFLFGKLRLNDRICLCLCCGVHHCDRELMQLARRAVYRRQGGSNIQPVHRVAHKSEHGGA